MSGPATVIEAVAQGNRVAREVAHFLETGERVRAEIPLEAHLPPLTWNMEAHSETPRLKPAAIPVEVRAGSFREVDLPAEEAAVRTECRRCLRCDLEWGQHMQAHPAERPAEPAAAPH